MIGRYHAFSQRIMADLAEIERAADKASRAFEASKRGGSDEAFYLDAAALNLHAFYSGVERLLEWLAREFEGTVPSGPAWHRELLDQMALEIPEVRPPVIRPTTRVALDEFLRFRHLVRNLYTWDFVPAKIADLIGRLPSTLQDLETDLAAFRQFLDAASRADETSG